MHMMVLPSGVVKRRVESWVGWLIGAGSLDRSLSWRDLSLQGGLRNNSVPGTIWCLSQDAASGFPPFLMV